MRFDLAIATAALDARMLGLEWRAVAHRAGVPRAVLESWLEEPRPSDEQRVWQRAFASAESAYSARLRGLALRHAEEDGNVAVRLLDLHTREVERRRDRAVDRAIKRADLAIKRSQLERGKTTPSGLADARNALAAALAALAGDDPPEPSG